MGLVEHPYLKIVPTSIFNSDSLRKAEPASPCQAFCESSTSSSIARCEFFLQWQAQSADYSLSRCSELITVAPMPYCTNSSDENYQICIPAGNSEVEFGLLDLLLESKLIYG